jgi:hypothetical protein
MSMTAHFTCEKCHQGFVLVQGMELSDITESGDADPSSIPMSEDSLSALARTRTSISSIDFINSLELHREKCDGKVVYQQEEE